MTVPLPEIITVIILGYSFLRELWKQGGLQFQASREDFESTRRFASIAETLITERKIVPHPIETRDSRL
jgi:hypothetical protein